MRRLFAPLALLPLALLGAAPAPPLQAVTGTQCRPGEVVAYSCRFGKSVGSVCMSAKSVSYRFGPAGHPSIDIRNSADWGNVHVGSQYSHALAQDHVRFTANGHDYVIFTQEAGPLSDVPGRHFSGIQVMRGKTDVTHLECRGRPIRREVWTSDVQDRASAATGGRARLTDEDPRFDMYF